MIKTFACKLGLHRECRKQANTGGSPRPRPEDLKPCECACHKRKQKAGALP